MSRIFINTVHPAILYVIFMRSTRRVGKSDLFGPKFGNIKESCAPQANSSHNVDTGIMQFSSGSRVVQAQDDLSWEVYTLLNYGVHGIVDFSVPEKPP